MSDIDKAHAILSHHTERWSVSLSYNTNTGMWSASKDAPYKSGRESQSAVEALLSVPVSYKSADSESVSSLYQRLIEKERGFFVTHCPQREEPWRVCCGFPCGLGDTFKKAIDDLFSQIKER